MLRKLKSILQLIGYCLVFGTLFVVRASLVVLALIMIGLLSIVESLRRRRQEKGKKELIKQLIVGSIITIALLVLILG